MQPSAFNNRQSQQSPKNQRSLFAFLIQIVAIAALVLCFFIYVGFEPKPTVTNTKLFPLFDSKEYHDLEKQIDSHNKVLLIGDEEDGIRIFIDQYITERNEILNIKRREYHYGKNLNYAYDNIFSKGYVWIMNGISHLLKTKETSEPILWLIENEGALNLKDINYINEFVLTHPTDKFLVVAEVAPSKASKFFQMIQYHELPSKIVSEHFYNNHKLDKVTASNLLNAYGSNLHRINEIFEYDNVALKFSESYSPESEELNELLLSNNKQVKGFFDKMCKNGFVTSKNELPYIPTLNNLVRYSKEQGVYEWKNIKALFAFSGRFNVICNANVDFNYHPAQPSTEQFWVGYLDYLMSSIAPSQNQTQVQQMIVIEEYLPNPIVDEEADNQKKDSEQKQIKKNKKQNFSKNKQDVKKGSAKNDKNIGKRVKKQVDKQVKKEVKKQVKQQVKIAKQEVKKKVEKEIKKQIKKDTAKITNTNQKKRNVINPTKSSSTPQFKVTSIQTKNIIDPTKIQVIRKSPKNQQLESLKQQMPKKLIKPSKQTPTIQLKKPVLKKITKPIEKQTKKQIDTKLNDKVTKHITQNPKPKKQTDIKIILKKQAPAKKLVLKNNEKKKNRR